jgi:hypothetical protein
MSRGKKRKNCSSSSSSSSSSISSSAAAGDDSDKGRTVVVYTGELDLIRIVQHEIDM